MQKFVKDIYLEDLQKAMTSASNAENMGESEPERAIGLLSVAVWRVAQILTEVLKELEVAPE